VSAADAGDFNRFQAKFDLLFVGSAAADVPAEIAGIMASVRAVHAAQGIRHAELRILLGGELRSPANAAVIDALLEGLGPDHRFVLSLDRADPWPGWERVREPALGPRGDKLVGIDFCAAEEGHPPKNLTALFAESTSSTPYTPAERLRSCSTSGRASATSASSRGSVGGTRPQSSGLTGSAMR